MTSIVGINCKDGVVIGTDSSATFTAGQVRTIEQPTVKIHTIRNEVIVAGTGPIGLSQRFQAVVEKSWNQPDIVQGKMSHLDIAKTLCTNTIQDFASTQVQRGTYGALLAFPVKGKTYLYEFGIQDFQPECKEDIWYCSMGSAQPITDPFLAFIRDVFWSSGQPTVSEAIFATTWTLDHAIETNPGGVNGPVHIAVLEGQNKPKARRLEIEELEEHRQCIQEAKKALREFRASYKADSSEIVPKVPEP